VTVFADVPEQPEAKRLLEAALADGPAHAYLLHGPAGVGKRAAARAFAGALLGDARRVDAGIHPDLRVLQPLGEMIRIDDIRALHHDLHMRPFEADRRVYLVFDAHRMNEDAAAALLKDLEEPPAYVTFLLVADELGHLPETIRSRCQLVPFRRLSREAVQSWIAERAPEAWYFTNARNEASQAMHRRLGFVEVTRAFTFPDWSFDGGDLLVRCESPDGRWREAWMRVGGHWLHYWTQSPSSFHSVGQILAHH